MPGSILRLYFWNVLYDILLRLDMLNVGGYADDGHDDVISSRSVELPQIKADLGYAAGHVLSFVLRKTEIVVLIMNRIQIIVPM